MTHFRQIPVMCFKVTGMLGPPVRYKYLLLAIYPSSTGTTRGILQLMSTPGERSEPQASEASPSRAKRGTLRRAKRGSEIVKSIELSAAPRRFTSLRCLYTWLCNRVRLSVRPSVFVFFVSRQALTRPRESLPGQDLPEPITSRTQPAVRITFKKASINR